VNRQEQNAWIAPSGTEISLEFRRHVGPRFIHGAVKLSFEASSKFIFISAVTWPDEQLDEVVAQAVREALGTAGPQHMLMQVTLKSIEWDEISSSASGFCRAAHAATIAALNLQP
jgi:hypothetical protein